MKTLKKHILPINPKFMAYGTANWRQNKKHLSKHYCFTDATVSQLRKLNVATIKACYDLDNPISRLWVPLLGNLIRIKDYHKVEEYLHSVKQRKQLKAA